MERGEERKREREREGDEEKKRKREKDRKMLVENANQMKLYNHEINECRCCKEYAIKVKSQSKQR